MCLLFVKTVVVIKQLYKQEYRSPIKHFTQMYSDCGPGGWGGGVIPYICYIGVCSAKEYGFFIFFGLKKGINFDQFGLGMFF